MSWSNFKLESDTNFESESLLAESNQVLQEFSNDSKELQKELQYFEYKNRSHNGEYFVFSYNAVTWESIGDIKQKYVDQYWGDMGWILVTDEMGRIINDWEIINSRKIYIKSKISDNPKPIEFERSIFPTAEQEGFYIKINTKWRTPSNLRQMFQDQNNIVIDKDAFSFEQDSSDTENTKIDDDYKAFQPWDKVVMYVRKKSKNYNDSRVDEIKDNDINIGEDSIDNSLLKWENSKESAIQQYEMEDDIDKYAEAIEKQTWRIAYGNKNNKEISITIDDGNSWPATTQILEMLNKKWIKATFFIIWSNIKLHKNIWKIAIDQWHQICCHTYSHIYLSDKSVYTSLWSKRANWIENVKRLLWDQYYENLWKKCTSGDFPAKIDSDLLLETEILMREAEVKDCLGEGYLNKMKNNYPFFRFPWWHWILNSTQEVKTRNVAVLKKMWYLSIWWSTDFVRNWRNQTANEVWSTSVPNGSIPLFHCKPEDVERISAYIKNEDNRGMTALPLSDILVLWNK